MGITKTIDYTKSELDIARYAKALAHPARIAIIQLLLKKHAQGQKLLKPLKN